MARDEILSIGGVPQPDKAATDEAALIGTLERLPKWLIVLPMVAQWLWLGVRHGCLTLPTAANPAITTGGLVGEGKAEYFRIMGPYARALTADFAVITNDADMSAPRAEATMRAAGLDYPLIVKPDIGWCGFGVHLVRDREELEDYLRRFPAGENIILQRFISFEGEAGLYYVREPDAPQGKLVGLLLRSFPRVVGDGQRTVAQLIAAEPRTSRLGRDGYSEPCCDLSYIPDRKETVRVSITGSTRVGGRYSDATQLITPALEAAIHAVASDMTQLHVARFDIRYESLGALQKGERFSIMEVNGAGSEAVQAWDPRYSLAQAYAMIFEKQRMLFAIGAQMKRRGHRPTGILALAGHYRRQAGLIRRYPPSN